MYYTYPIEVNDGDIRLHIDEATAVRDAFIHCLDTVREERVMRPEYGLPDVLFQGASLSVMRSLVVEVLSTGMVGFDVVYDLNMTIADGSFLVAVTWDDNVLEVLI